MAEQAAEMRYGFGKNWAEFIEKNFNEAVVEDSMRLGRAHRFRRTGTKSGGPSLVRATLRSRA